MNITTKYHYYMNQITLFAWKRSMRLISHETVDVSHFKNILDDLKAMIEWDHALLPGFLQPIELNFVLNHIINVNVQLSYEPLSALKF